MGYSWIEKKFCFFFKIPWWCISQGLQLKRCRRYHFGVELVSKELNHLGAILHVYARVWFLWSKINSIKISKKHLTSYVNAPLVLELVSKELNHFAGILHVYAGDLHFMKKKNSERKYFYTFNHFYSKKSSKSDSPPWTLTICGPPKVIIPGWKTNLRKTFANSSGTGEVSFFVSINWFDQSVLLIQKWNETAKAQNKNFF